MPPITHARLTSYRKLADDIDAAIERRDEIGADTIRDVLPEFREAADAINAALKEVDALLFEGLRDEAAGLHDPDLAAVASQLNILQRPQWPDVELWWLVDMGLAEPPRIDTDALANLEAVHGELDGLKKGLERLRRMALERASTAKKLAALRQMRSHDSTKLVWSKSVASHEDARLRELRAEIPRVLGRADFNLLAEIHAELVDPDWESEVPRDLVNATRGADIAATLEGLVARADELSQQIQAHHSASAEPTHVHFDKLLDLRTRLEEVRPVADDCVAQLQSCQQMLAVVRKKGLDTACQAMEQGLSPAFDWIAACERLHATRAAFTTECRRLEYLCDHLPEKAGESKWLADVHRSESEIRHCCQQISDLTFPELLHERLRKATGIIASRENLRSRFVLVAAASLVFLLGGITAFSGWRYWAHGERERALATLKEAVKEARQGVYLERPDEVVSYAGAYSKDAKVTKLLREFDECVEAEKERRTAFDQLIVGHKESLESVAPAIEERKRKDSDQARLGPWPAPFVESAKLLSRARGLGGLPAKRGGSTGGDLPSSARRHFEKEEKDLAEREAEQEQLDGEIEQMAVEAFARLRDSLRDRIPEAEADDASTEARSLLKELRALRSLASAKKADGLSGALADDKRVPQDVLESLEILEKRLEVITKGSK